MKLRVRPPSPFDWRRTVESHGWCLLAPFEYDASSSGLSTVIVDGRTTRRVDLAPQGRDIEVAVFPAPSARDRQATERRVRRAVARMLAFELDLAPFHAALSDHPDWGRIARRGKGRFLRAPSTFEDVVKLVLTTNCTWAFTRRMVDRLIEGWGVGPAGRRAFPTPRSLAVADEAALRERARTGYRSASLVALARGFLDGSLDPTDALFDSELPAAELEKRLRRLPGAGPYVAQNLMRFHGKPRGLGLDSWLRTRYYRRYHGGRTVKDRTIERRYAAAGPWAGWVVWFDLARPD